MNIFVINPFSANTQYASVEDFEKAFGNIMGILDYTWPAISKGKIILIYDKSIESRNLLISKNFISAIAQIKDSSLRERWYRYIKNKAKFADMNSTGDFLIEKSASVPLIFGICSLDVTKDNSHWISFGGDSFHDEEYLTVYSSFDDKIYEVSNSDNSEKIKTKLPQYEPNPKHRQREYKDTRGRIVSPMPLSNEAAQKQLMIATECRGDYFSYHDQTDKFYRFKKTGGNVYHGFQIAESDVPASILSAIK